MPLKLRIYVRRECYTFEEAHSELIKSEHVGPVGDKSINMIINLPHVTNVPTGPLFSMLIYIFYLHAPT